MTTITLKGNPIHTCGTLPAVGSKAIAFDLVKSDLSHLLLSDIEGKKIVLNIFPSLDTPTCAASVRKFNQIASEKPNTLVVCISRDLPFAQARFCGAEGLQNVVTASDFISGSFGKLYGLEISDGPLQGLHSRCVIVLNEMHELIYTQQVSEITEEPNYEAALKFL